MSISTLDSTPEERTEHPHVVRIPGVCGGRATVRGSRVPVWLIARLFRAGYTPAEIAQEFGHLPLTGIYDAVSYYLDHRSEIDQDIADNRLEQALTAARATLDELGRLDFAPPESRE